MDGKWGESFDIGAPAWNLQKRGECAPERGLMACSSSCRKDRVIGPVEAGQTLLTSDDGLMSRRLGNEDRFGVSAKHA